MTRRLALLGCLLLGAGCRAPQPAPDDALTDVLAALYLLEARQTTLGDVPRATRDSILVLHGLTADEFSARLQRWSASPAASDSLYARVERRLEGLMDQAADSLSR